MISTLSGRVTHIGEQSLTLEVGGVGYEVNAPVPLLAEAHSGQSLSLHTYLVVRETEMTLYGFATLEARQLFTMLLGVNGVCFIGHGRSTGKAIKNALRAAGECAANKVVQHIREGIALG